MVGRVLGWKRRDLSSGFGSITAWISQFGHLSASVAIGFLTYKIKTLDQVIFKVSSNMKIQCFC